MGRGLTIQELSSTETAGLHDRQTHDDIPPDGGFAAWTQVGMGHLVIFNCWGYITS